MFILASSVTCPLVDDYLSLSPNLSLNWGFPFLVCFDFRVVLGSVCMMPRMLIEDHF